MLILAGCGTLDTLQGAASGNPSDIAKTVETGKQGAEVGQKVAKANEDFTPEQEYYIGRTVAATVLGIYKPWDGPKANEYLNTLGNSLAVFSVLPETFKGYHFLIMDTDEINAFGAPSGFVLISRGLLRCAASEDEVAAILAHEIGHVSLKHGMKAISSSRKTEALQLRQRCSERPDRLLRRGHRRYREDDGHLGVFAGPREGSGPRSHSHSA
jgi:predicted Zn-dependent protease